MSKGIALSELPAIVVVLVVAGLTLYTGIIAMNNVKSALPVATTTEANETIGNAVADSRKWVTAFGHPPSAGSSGVLAISAVMNTTTAAIGGNNTICLNCELVHSACASPNCNYTYNQSHINASINGTGYYSGAWLVTYTWTNNWTAQMQIAANTTNGIYEISTWFPTIGLVIAAAVIIGIVFTAFMRKEEFA